MFSVLAVPGWYLRVPSWRIELPPLPPFRDVVMQLTNGLVLVVVAMLVAVSGHGDLLGHMSIFQGSQEIKGVTEFLGKIKGYLLSIVLAGFTIAAIGAGAAKFVGHSRANDLLFNIGMGVAIFAAIPTLAE